MILRKLRQNRKPNGPVKLNRANPFSRDVLSAFMGAEHNNAGFRDIISNTQLTKVNSPTVSQSLAGSAVEFDKTVELTVPQYFTGSLPEAPNGNAFWITFICIPRSADADNFRYAVSTGTYNTANTLNIAVDHDGGVNPSIGTLIGTTTTGIDFSGGFSTLVFGTAGYDRPICYTLWNNQDANEGGHLARFLDTGELIGIQSTTATSDLLGATDLWIGGRGDLQNQRFYDGGILAVVYGIGDTARGELLLEASKAPWQIFSSNNDLPISYAAIIPPTTFHRYVDPDATGTGDGTSWTNAYTSLATCLTSEAKDLTISNELAVINCRSSAGTDDITGAAVSTSWIEDSTRYLTIQCTGIDKATNVWDDSKYVLKSGNYPLRIYTHYTRVYGVQVWTYLPDVACIGIWIATVDAATDCHIRVIDNIVRGPGVSSANTQIGIYMAGLMTGNSVVTDNIIYDYVNSSGDFSGATALYINAPSMIGHDVYNNTTGNCSVGIRTVQSGVTKVVNNIAQANATYANSGFLGTFAVGSDYNLSSEAADDMPGINSVVASLSFKAANDYHLDASDIEAIGAGVGPSVDSAVPTIDGDGDLRSGATTDIGADMTRLSNILLLLNDSGGF